MRMQLNGWVWSSMLVGCAPGPGLVFEAPAQTESWTGGGGSSGAASTGEFGEDTGLPPGTTLPPGTSLPPTTDPEDPTAMDPTGMTGEDSGEGGAIGVLVPAQSTWQWHAGAAPAGDWLAAGFDDATWSKGQAPLVSPTPLPEGALVRLRHTFTVTGDVAAVPDLMVYLRRDDAAAVFLNGHELARSNLPLGAWSEGLKADGAAKGSEAERYFRAVAPADALVAGDNVVAVALHGDAGDPDRGFDLQMGALDLAQEPGDSMGVQVRTTTYGGEYGDEHVLAIWVEQAGKFVKTLAAYGDERRQHLIKWNAVSGGDTTDAMTGATRSRHQTHVVAWDLTDASGQPAAPGSYTLRVEFTEDNSNKGEPAGPSTAVAFELGGGPRVTAVAADARFRDWLVIAP